MSCWQGRGLGFGIRGFGVKGFYRVDPHIPTKYPICTLKGP